MLPTDAKIIIFSAPSGAGKTTIVQAALKHLPQLAFSISATTRPKRPHEQDGRDYYFVSPEKFSELIQKNAFVEWEEVYKGRFYGTLYTELERIHRLNKYPVFEVDVKGGLSLKKLFGKQALGFFINPPSLEILRERLRTRATEDLPEIENRIAKAELELGYASQFDEIVLNDNLEKAVEKVLEKIQGFVRS